MCLSLLFNPIENVSYKNGFADAFVSLFARLLNSVCLLMDCWRCFSLAVQGRFEDVRRTSSDVLQRTVIIEKKMAESRLLKKKKKKIFSFVYRKK